MSNNINVKDVDQNIKYKRVYTRDELIKEFRLIKVEENGKKNVLPRKYQDKNKWIQITDIELFLRTHPNYLHKLANDFDNWWVFMTIDNPKLNSDEELKKKLDDLKSKHKDELKDWAFDNNITKEQLSSYTYYQIKNILDSIKK